MNRNEIADVLTACAALDQRKVGDSDVSAWYATIRPDIDRQLALDAVRIHYATSTDRAMPGHINNLAVQIRRDRAEREKADEIHNLAITGPNPAAGYLPIPTDGKPVWAAYEVNGAIDRACPRCHAKPREACMNPITRQETKIACLVRYTGKPYLGKPLNFEETA